MLSFLCTHSILLSFRCTDYKLRTITQSSPEGLEMASRRVQAYSEFFELIQLGSPSNVIQFVFDVLITLLSFRSITLPVTAQIINLFSILCHNIHTQTVLLSLESSRRLVTQHHTMHFYALYQPHAGRLLSSFYAALTELMLVRASPGDLEHFCSPLIIQLQQLQQDPPNNSEAFCICLREITGILRSCTKSQQYITLYDLMYFFNI